MPNSPRNVCELVVPNDLCIGCGVCAGICPVNVLTMRFDEFGAYVPVEEEEGCLPKCDLCLRACPFTDQEDDEDTLAQVAFGQTAEIQHTPELGYYLDTYIGYSRVDGHRENGASGGLATWFLETLLTRDMVDKVICVTPYPGNPQRLFRFAVLDSVEAVRKASRSCYYPVEMSEVIRHVLSHDGRYAITGLPCFLKGLRLAMRKNRRLRHRIIAMGGLVCGQTKTRFFVEYLCALCGGDPADLVEVQFRLKDSDRSAKDYAHRFIWKNHEQLISRKIYWSEGIQKVWTHDYFKPNACNFCDDVFAETADVVFMDAWLPQYSQDPRGHSLVINRREDFKPIWDDVASSNEISLQPIAADLVIRSQSGQLHHKRELLSYRLFRAKRAERRVPRKRVDPSADLSILECYLVKLKSDARRKSLSIWGQHQDPRMLQRVLRKVDVQIEALRWWKQIRSAFREGRVVSALMKRGRYLLPRKDKNA
jgi:coenzyme F420 hydrogenase subunit beta